MDFIDSQILDETEFGCAAAGNVTGASWEYMVISTHVHFDHIGGIHAFSAAGAHIVASGYDRNFLLPKNRPASSLCENFNINTPRYKISHFANDHERLHYKGNDLGLIVLQTPGHTPDELAVFDEDERVIFLGDTAYRRVKHEPWGEKQDVPIILVLQSDWKDWLGSLKKLVKFVEKHNNPTSRIIAACGHTTAGIPAGKLLHNALHFANRVADGDVPIIARLPGDEVAPGGTLGDAMFVFWQDDGNPEFSLIAPEDFIDDFAKTAKERYGRFSFEGRNEASKGIRVTQLVNEN